MTIPNSFRQPILLDNRRLRDENPNIAAHFAACEEELSAFPTQQGVIRDRNIVKYIPCPCCGNPNTQQWAVKLGGRYDLCAQCGHIFLKNMFRRDVLTKLYKKSIADELDREVNRHAFNRRYWSAVYNKYIDMICSIHPLREKLSILDVGCGAGLFLEVCRERGLDCEGVDVFDGVLDALEPILSRDKLHQADDILDFSPGCTYNVVTMWGVLEHLPDTQNIFHKCAELLNNGGIMLGLIPNIHSRAVRYLGVSVPTLNPREHVNFYSQTSLEKVASQAGLIVENVLNELPVIDLMWPFIDQSDPTVIEDIISHDESYYLVYILRKNN
jgi:2-polyprenyl-3-methyl-5-hydroxy-6-metoxy-1,4-benzoquinol methylase